MSSISNLGYADEPMNRNRPQLTIVVPCYNEEQVLPETAARLSSLVHDLISAGRIDHESGICFVDDGSNDRTWESIERFIACSGCKIQGIKLSRNHGHQNAILAGLLTVPGDAIVSIDADLQDDLSSISEMLIAFAAGAEIVYGVRRGRPSDGWFKRAAAEGYYRLLATMGVEIVFNHADFRLMSRRALEALRQFPETNLFLRGLIPQLGFNTATVFYDRGERFAGESKYPLRKMLRLAVDGITSFSAVPLRLITLLGILLSFISLGTAIWALWVRLVNPAAVPGWASTVIPIYLLGGIQLLCVGILGQYLAKIYIETKSRPRFIIEKVLTASPSDRQHEAGPSVVVHSQQPFSPGAHHLSESRKG